MQASKVLVRGASNLLPTMEDCCAACWAHQAPDGTTCNAWNFCNSPLGCARRGSSNRTYPLVRVATDVVYSPSTDKRLLSLGSLKSHLGWEVATHLRPFFCGVCKP